MVSAVPEEGQDSPQATTWGSTLTRSYSRRLKPLLSRVQKPKWEADEDLGATGIQHSGGKWHVWILAYQTLGAVYGDIGTSPLYVFASIFAEGNVEPSPENFVGLSSLIIWSLTALALIKYAFIVLRADDNGQGGSLALYSQLRRQGLLTAHHKERVAKAANASARSNASRHALSEATVEAVKVPTTDWKQRLISGRAMQNVLRVMVVLGVGLIMGDGVLTPAVTIVSAMEGLQIATTGVSRDLIVGLSCAIISGLFIVQRFGPSKLGFLFSPVVCVYFAFNSGIGIYNIFTWDATIFKAISPHYWFRFFLNNGHEGWRVLAGVLLCFTGTEAMFADIGHFSRRSIQMGFTGIVYPSLVLMYLGQAAYLINNPQDVPNAFWASLPGGKPLFWPMFIVVTLASIVASQALISATFAIVSQALRQNFFPRFHVTHTSKTHTGQIYIAVVNFTLMVLTLIITIVFKTSARLSNAYGLAVVCDMLLTTCFTTLIMLTVWRKPILVPIVFFIIFAIIESAFLSSSLLKVPRGGWFSIMMAGIFAYVMLLWFWGTRVKARFFSGTQQSLAQFLKARGRPPPPHAAPVPTSNGGEMPSVESIGNVALLAEPEAAVQQLPGVGLYYCSAIHGVPHVLSKTAQMYPSLPQACIFLTNRNVPLPEVLPSERLLVQQLGCPGFYHVIARYGYVQQIKQDRTFITDVMRHIQALLYRTLVGRLAASDALSPLAHRRKLSRSVARVVNGAVGEFYGEGHPSPELTQNTVSNAHMSLSTHGLSNEHSRNEACRTRRPTILDDAGNLTWPLGEDGNRAPAPADIEMAIAEVGDGSSSSGKKPTSPLVPKPELNGMVAAVEPDAFEVEMADWANEMKPELDDASAKRLAEETTLEPLRRLATELSLVAAATLAGSRGYVIGRSSGQLKKGISFLELPKRYVAELPFLFLAKNTEQDMGIAFGCPEEEVLEVGLKYKLG